MRRLAIGPVAALLALLTVPTPSVAAPAIDPACAALHGQRWAAATGVTDPRGTLRVFAVQWTQDISRVTSYAAFKQAVRCTIEEQVVPHERPGEPTLVVFDEDIGLMTAAAGVRGAELRAQLSGPLKAPLGDTAPAPVGAALLIGGLTAAYAPQIAAYTARFGPVDPRKAGLLAATDTFVRAFNTTFSDVARELGIYVLACNSEANDYRESHDAAEVALFGDPSEPGTAYVATTPRVTNTAYVWGPQDVHPDAPDGMRNLLSRTEKVPLTDTESTLLALDPGPSTGAAGLANAQPVTIAGWHLGIGISLPAFVYGYPFGQRPAGLPPCADTSRTWMACLDHLGADVLLQPDANPGRWTGPASQDPWQPLEWMSSAWRAVADPTVHFRYAVNPMMVGNLADLPFDGQSAILQRGAQKTPARYIGDGSLQPEDNPDDAVYAGDKPQFLALTPWVVPDADRASLRAEGGRLAPGSGDPREDDYLETAVYADLVPVSTVPRNAARPPVVAPVVRGPGGLAATGAAPGSAPAALALLLAGVGLLTIRPRLTRRRANRCT